MQRRTLRTLIVLCVVFDLLLLGALLYDYLQNDSDWAVYLLIAFAAFLVIAILLFLLRPSDRVIERVVQKEVEKEEVVEFQPVHAIPPAPIQVLRENPPRRIPAPPRPRAKPTPRPAVVRKVRRPVGPFRYRGYTLHEKIVRDRGGGSHSLYFFSKRKPKSGRPCRKPRGYRVGVYARTGLPYLSKGGRKATRITSRRTSRRRAVRPIRRRRARRAPGPFRYRGYTLHAKQVPVKGGGSRTLYFFAKKKPKSGKPSRKPRGYKVGANSRSGLPYLKK